MEPEGKPEAAGEPTSPRLLIQAIQRNLGITKKEIAERAGVSYGTVQRYSRADTVPRRPRSHTLERLRELYRRSLQRESWWAERPGPGPRGEAGRTLTALLWQWRLPARPVLQFLERTLALAREDADHLQRGGLRNRQPLLESQAAVGDLYLSLVHALAAERLPPLPGGAPPRAGRDAPWPAAEHPPGGS